MRLICGMVLSDRAQAPPGNRSSLPLQKIFRPDGARGRGTHTEDVCFCIEFYNVFQPDIVRET